MTPDRPLEGRAAVVTGASRGIGSAIAQRLASAGAHVVLGARSVERPVGGFAGTVHETAEVIRAAGGTATPLALDVTDDASRRAFVAAAIEATGGIDVLVNNAGTALYEPIGEYTLEQATAQVQSYFLGPWRLCNLLVPHMIDRGRGWILNLGSSSVAKTPEPPYDRHLEYFGHDALYASLKAAVHRLTQGLAAELYGHGIAVNLVAPVGGVFTPGLDSLGLGFGPDHAACEIPEQIAEAALDLVTRPPTETTGVIAFSHRYLDDIGRPTHSLDGRTVLVDRTPRGATP
ncbi:SDR family NAD(P)-dependent oxidoreductase [Trujillonella endophytica]|uniref:NADP-dependent 3-hydroxy acid dehydrogenase YdfG n=1 Tax=Trujillonella endophytica TaxID=673521 RepID=A0A1H8Q5Q4_9ACTN|nr:SDR family NAD(P)-dependent oxidoreductase [Trujillella endophytica]SEO49406.1 NADP-dependent 3-hydroxy acid dehydrogenase YdfG [Trujillella endophytica]